MLFLLKSWRLVLLVEETEIPGENHRTVASHWQTLTHNVVSSTPRLELTTLVVIDTDCTGSCKSNYHTIRTTTTPVHNSISLISYEQWNPSLKFCTAAVSITYMFDHLTAWIVLLLHFNSFIKKSIVDVVKEMCYPCTDMFHGNDEQST